MRTEAGGGIGHGGSRRPAGLLRAVRVVVIGTGVIAWAAWGCAREPQRAEQPRSSARQEIRNLLAGGVAGLGVADTAGAESTWAMVRAFYAQRGEKPAWSGRGPRRQVTALLGALEQAAAAGLDPRDYDTAEIARLLAMARRRDPIARLNRARVLARLDVRATYACLRFAPHLRDGRVPRALLDSEWTSGDVTTDWTGQLKRWVGHDPARSLAELEPRHGGYLRLRQALGRYRAIAAAGGWPGIPPGPPLAAGARGERVARLVRRLAATGDLAAPVRDTVFDRRVQAAIGAFQSRNGIPVSGILGEATRAALNVPVEARIRQMELNLERWRWLPGELGARHIAINIPAFRLELVRGDTVHRAMRVVVGRRQSPTPVFSDHIVYVEVNPTWTLPPSVVQKEIVPVLRRKPDYLAANQMTVISIASAKRDTVDPGDVPWKLALTDSFPYLIIQAAGPENPLGRVKLMCPNEYDVYLHDSPQRSRFGVAVRDYSHGCVRVEEAIELADSLIAGTPGDTLPVDSLVARGEWKRLRLAEPMPVHFLYWTAWVDSAGREHFREDVYGLDARLDEALRTRSTARLVLNPGVAVSPFWLAAEAKAREATERAAAARAARRAQATAARATATRTSMAQAGGARSGRGR